MNYEFCNGYTYTIKQGDTLYEISKKLDVPLALILRANPYVDVFNLQIGDTLCIPERERPLPPPPAPGRPPVPPMPSAPGRPLPPPVPERPPVPSMPPAPGRPPVPSMPPAPGRPSVPSMPPAPGRLPVPSMPSAPGRPLPPQTPPGMRMSEEQDDHGMDTEGQGDETWSRHKAGEGNMEEEAWIRYVVQPGDTILELVKSQEMLEKFIDRNGMENIYMLPGIAYYVPER